MRSRPLVVEGKPVTHALVCITAFASNNARRVAILREVLSTVAEWQLRTHTVAITQDKELLLSSLGEDAAGALLQQIEETRPREKHMLAWAHRSVIERARRSKTYQLFLYLEDDIKLSWAALQAWALDEALLQRAFGRGLLHRGFFRFEQCGKGLLSAPTICCFDPDACSFSRAAGSALLSRGIERWQCKVSVRGRRFVGLPNPYHASWVMGPAQLERFVHSAHWHTSTGRVPGGVREAAAAGDAYLSIASARNRSELSDCSTTSLVPYTLSNESGAIPRLDHAAGVQHLGQNYGAKLHGNVVSVDDCIRGGVGRLVAPLEVGSWRTGIECALLLAVVAAVCYVVGMRRRSRYPV